MRHLRSLGLAVVGMAFIATGLNADARSARAPNPATPNDGLATTQSTHEAVNPSVTHRDAESSRAARTGPVGPRQTADGGEPFPASDSTRTTQSGRNTRMTPPSATPSPSASPR